MNNNQSEKNDGKILQIYQKKVLNYLKFASLCQIFVKKNEKDKEHLIFIKKAM